ncbi:MAG: hypothetical protein Q8M17_05885 [Actinomycetota bacterium]|nr:hypothetical protein [Actinomycetota bacterium]
MTAVLIAGSAAMAGAGPAAAASGTTLDCAVSSTVSWAVSPGGSVGFEVAATCDALNIYVPGTMGTVTSSVPGAYFPNPQGSVGITPLPPNPWTYVAPVDAMCSNSEFSVQNSAAGTSVTVVVSNCPGATDSSTGSASQSTPAMWDLAYQRSGPNAPCLPNFVPSWAQWPNGGTGGFTCKRTIPATGPTSWKPGITRPVR